MTTHPFYYIMSRNHVVLVVDCLWRCESHNGMRGDEVVNMRRIIRTPPSLLQPDRIMKVVAVTTSIVFTQIRKTIYY